MHYYILIYSSLLPLQICFLFDLFYSSFIHNCVKIQKIRYYFKSKIKD